MERWPQFSHDLTTPWWGFASADTAGPALFGAPPAPAHNGWPALGTIEYFTKLIVLALLVLALPYLIGKLLTSPGEVFGSTTGRAVSAALK